jgi:hypothetical protein
MLCYDGGFVNDKQSEQEMNLYEKHIPETFSHINN